MSIHAAHGRVASTRSAVADRFAPFGTTIFTEMTRLAIEHGAVNLAQGFPDFDGPEFVKDAAVEAIREGRGQYARMSGDPALNRAIAAWWKSRSGIEADPDAEVTVTSGCTEAIAAAMLGLINAGDGVVLFEPYYDSYRASVAMAGGDARFVTLRPPASGGGPFEFRESELRRAFAGTNRSAAPARAVLLNSPHNPTGKVFSRTELELIASLCIEHDAIAITDEVYGELVYNPALPHVSLASLPGMRERTITLSSLGKTFSLTGWKVGWAIACPRLTSAVRAAHQFLTFATATPLQIGASIALRDGDAYIAELVAQYRDARDYLAQALRDLGFKVFVPDGAYFIMVDHSQISGAMGLADDVAFCRHLTAKVGVAAIPPSVFYSDPQHGRALARFAFCKKRATLDAAITRLAAVRSSLPG